MNALTMTYSFISSSCVVLVHLTNRFAPNFFRHNANRKTWEINQLISGMKIVDVL